MTQVIGLEDGVGLMEQGESDAREPERWCYAPHRQRWKGPYVFHWWRGGYVTVVKSSLSMW